MRGSVESMLASAPFTCGCNGHCGGHPTEVSRTLHEYMPVHHTAGVLLSTWLVGAGAGYRVQDTMCRVHSAGCRVQATGYRVHRAGCRVHGTRVQGAGYRVQLHASYTVQGTECRAQLHVTECRAHCVGYTVQVAGYRI